MRFFHRTTATNANAIMGSGFRDGTGTYLTDEVHTGIWISDVPLNENEGAGGDALLEVVIDAAAIDDFEWVQEPSCGYRERLVPAALLNDRAQVRLLDEVEEDAATIADGRFEPIPRSD